MMILKGGRAYTINIVAAAVTAGMVLLPLFLSLDEATLDAYVDLMTRVYVWVVGFVVAGPNAANVAESAKSGRPASQ